MHRPLALLVVLMALPASAQDWLTTRPAPKAGTDYPALYCVNRGERVELGETACIRTNCCPITGCETFVARCALSTNVTTWRKERDGCPPDQLSARPPPPSVPRARG